MAILFALDSGPVQWRLLVALGFRFDGDFDFRFDGDFGFRSAAALVLCQFRFNGDSIFDFRFNDDFVFRSTVCDRCVCLSYLS